MSRVRAAAAIAVLAITAGCGGDEAARKPPGRAPELTVPRTEPPSTTTTPTGAADTPPPTSTSGGTVTSPAAPAEGDAGTGGAAPRTAPDGPEHDVPPPPGSPAERFEKDCESRPKACG